MNGNYTITLFHYKKTFYNGSSKNSYLALSYLWISHFYFRNGIIYVNSFIIYLFIFND